MRLVRIFVVTSVRCVKVGLAVELLLCIRCADWPKEAMPAADDMICEFAC